MQFSYKVKDKKGKTIAGTVDATSKLEAVKLLRERNFLIITVEDQKKNTSFGSALNLINRVSFNTVVNFTRLLATMITAGLPLVDSLAILGKQATSSQFRGVVDSIIEKIRAGESFAQSLAAHPHQFNRMFISLVEAGERSGKLDVVLERLADTLEKQRAFKSKIQTAMIYPLIVVIGMIGLMVLMMIMVVPKLTEIYDQFDIDLPLPTQILIFISKTLVNYWWLLLAGLGIFIIWFMSFRRTSVGNKIIDTIILRIPIWGTLKRDLIMGEMTRTLGLLVGAGVPILDGLSIVADALESRTYSDNIREIASKVEKGFALGVLFSNDPLYPPIVGQMVMVGEETGKMDETLTRVAAFFDSSSDEKVKRLTTALEPIILVSLGGGVAFLVLSIVLPLYQLTQAF